MRRALAAVLVGSGALLLAACAREPGEILGVEESQPTPHHAPGHGGGGGNGGGGGESPPVDVTLSGGLVTSNEAGGIARENRNVLEVGGLPGCPDDPICFGTALALASMAGFSSQDVIDARSGILPPLPSGCVTTPTDLASSDPATLMRLIGQLDDGPQDRLFKYAIDKRTLGSPDKDNSVFTSWWDPDGDRVNGYRYRGTVGEHAEVAGAPTVVRTGSGDDDWRMTGGTVRIWSTPQGGGIFDFGLTCPTAVGSFVDMSIIR